MSIKSRRRGQAGVALGTTPPRARRVRLYAAALSGLPLLGAGCAATRYGPVRKAVGMRPLPLLPAAQGGGPGSLPPAKQYIYAGGRLVATAGRTTGV